MATPDSIVGSRTLHPPLHAHCTLKCTPYCTTEGRPRGAEVLGRPTLDAPAPMGPPPLP